MEYLLYKYWDPINKNRFLYKDIAITKNLFSSKEVSKKLSMPTIGFFQMPMAIHPFVHSLENKEIKTLPAFKTLERNHRHLSVCFRLSNRERNEIDDVHFKLLEPREQHEKRTLALVGTSVVERLSQTNPLNKTTMKKLWIWCGKNCMFENICWWWNQSRFKYKSKNKSHTNTTPFDAPPLTQNHIA